MLKIALALTASLVLAAPAVAQTADQGFEYPPGLIGLVPGGVVAVAQEGRTNELLRLDDETGAEGQIAEIRVGYVTADTLDTDGDRVAYSLPGQLWAGAIDGAGIERIRRCADEIDPAPLAVSGDVIVAAACGNADETSSDVTATNLKSGKTTNLAKGALVRDGAIRAAYPYAAIEAKDGIRVYDLRDRSLKQTYPAASAFDVTSAGELKTCSGCDRVEVTAASRVVELRGRDFAVDGKTVATSAIDDPYWDADDEHGVVFFDQSCRGTTLRFAALDAAAETTDALKCRPNAPTVKLKGRSAVVTFSCPVGCAGEVTIYPANGVAKTARIDPEPGEKTAYKLKLAPKSAAKLAHDRLATVEVRTTGDDHLTRFRKVAVKVVR